MRIEIMIDKEQKISQATLDALETELYHNALSIPKQQFAYVREALTAWS